MIPTTHNQVLVIILECALSTLPVFPFSAKLHWTCPTEGQKHFAWNCVLDGHRGNIHIYYHYHYYEVDCYYKYMVKVSPSPNVVRFSSDMSKRCTIAYCIERNGRTFDAIAHCQWQLCMASCYNAAQLHSDNCNDHLWVMCNVYASRTSSSNCNDRRTHGMIFIASVCNIIQLKLHLMLVRVLCVSVYNETATVHSQFSTVVPVAAAAATQWLNSTTSATLEQNVFFLFAGIQYKDLDLAISMPRQAWK